MKRAILGIAILVLIPGIMYAQEDQDTAQKIQNINIKIIQLSSQRDYNNQMILELNRKALTFDQQIKHLTKQRQELQKLQPQVEKKPTPK